MSVRPLDSYISCYLQDIFEDDLNDPDLQTAFSQGKNRRMALIGDSILNLVVKLEKYEELNSSPEDIHNAGKDLAKKKAMQAILNKDVAFTKYLKEKHECTSPVGNIGLQRADDFMEAIIGAIFLTKGYKISKQYVLKILQYLPIECELDSTDS